MELKFDSLNTFQMLQYLEAATAEELRAQLIQIRTQAKIISLYYAQGKHIAWFVMEGKLVKKKETKK